MVPVLALRLTPDRGREVRLGSSDGHRLGVYGSSMISNDNPLGRFVEFSFPDVRLRLRLRPRPRHLVLHRLTL